MWKWLVLTSLAVARWLEQPTPEVRVSGGLVRGTVSPDGLYRQYLGIPYATVNSDNRFQQSLPEAQWDGVFDAINENVKCPQRFLNSIPIVIGKEDCLTLNVYTPLNAEDLLPVMVFIHGGGFREGSNSPYLYGAEHLVPKGVILVAINYRLEILGFLCLGIKEAPGNSGLKDQVTALKWVKNNIRSFGGNPEQITLFGESAGASSVAYHLLSPMSKGLFRRAIMQSGTAITPWGFQFDPLETAVNFAKQLGYETRDPKKLFEIFNSKSANELLSTRVPRLEGATILSETLFVPCVEKHIPGVNSFIDDYPYNIFAKGNFNKNIEIIIGHNNAEGLMFAGKENSTMVAKLNFLNALPRDLKFTNEKEKNELADKVHKMYLNKEKISEKTMEKMAKFYGDPFFKLPVLATTDFLLKYNKAPIWNYNFSYDGFLNTAKAFYRYPLAPGATHADELFYMFSTKFPTFSWLERNIVHQFTTLWTNFAKYGNPKLESVSNLKWEPTSKEDPEALIIDREFSLAPLWNQETLFWNDTYTKYRRKK